MNELLERAAMQLNPDVSKLVDGARRRGRTRIRRGRIVRGTGVLAGAAVVAVAGFYVVSPSSPLDTTAATGGVSTAGKPPAGHDAGGPSYPPPPPTAEAEAALRAALPGGAKVTGLTLTTRTWALGHQGYQAQFRLDDALVELEVDRNNADAGTQPGGTPWTPAVECEESAPVLPCRTLPDGSLAYTSREHPEGGDSPADEVLNQVLLWRADGWSFTMSAWNSTSEKSGDEGGDAVVAAHPPLTVAQLTTLARAGFWFG